jgi:hypothetical protein
MILLYQGSMLFKSKELGLLPRWQGHIRRHKMDIDRRSELGASNC